MKMLLKLVKMVAVGVAITVVSNKIKEVVEVEKFAVEGSEEVKTVLTKVTKLSNETISEIVEVSRLVIVWFAGYGVTLLVTGMFNKTVSI